MPRGKGGGQQKHKQKQGANSPAPSQPSVPTIDATAYAQSYHGYDELETLHKAKPKVGYLCIYNTFEALNVTTDSKAEMGQAVTQSFMANTGELVNSGAQGIRLSADDSRAMIILAEKYGFRGPRAARGGPLSTIQFAGGTKIIGFCKIADTNPVLLSYLPANGEATAPDALKAVTDPRLYSVEFHAICGIVKPMGGTLKQIDWTDTQGNVFPKGPTLGTFFVWWEL